MKKLSNGVLLVVLSLVPGLCRAQQENLTMSGFVYDKNSRPVVGARVTIAGNKAISDTMTDVDGEFVLNLARGVLEGETVLIRVDKSGYKPYEKWLPVSSAIALHVSLESTQGKRSDRQARPAIEKIDSFLTLVPFHGEWKNSPIPMNENLADKHQEFYSSLLELASRPDTQTEGWPPYGDRKFESIDEQYRFVTGLVQFDVFKSIYLLQRGVVGLKSTVGGGVTPINKRPITPPEAVAYPKDELMSILASNEFMTPTVKMLFESKPLSVPPGTRVFFSACSEPAKGQALTCIVRLERPGYFRLDFEIQPGIGANNQVPAGFSTSAVNGTTTYSVNVAMKYEIQSRTDHGFHADQYAAWADSLFAGLKEDMAFDSATSAEPSPIVTLHAYLQPNAAQPYPVGTKIGGIDWTENYVDVRLDIQNGPKDIHDLDVIVGLDTSIAGIGQISQFQGISIFPGSQFPAAWLEGQTADGNSRQVPITPLPGGPTIEPTYRVRCSEIYRETTVNLAIASVALNPVVSGHAPEQIFAARTVPKEIEVKGTYRADNATYPIELHTKF